jgi:hypothetical protein
MKRTRQVNFLGILFRRNTAKLLQYRPRLHTSKECFSASRPSPVGVSYLPPRNLVAFDVADHYIGLLLAIPFGRLADNPKFGRRLVLLLNVLGVYLRIYWVAGVCWFADTLPLRLVWFAPALTILGGGSGLTPALLFTIITDVVEDRQRYRSAAPLPCSRSKIKNII